jgi:hypothetical protein
MTTILMDTIKKQIQEIESKIASQQGDVEQLKRLLERLKYQQFGLTGKNACRILCAFVKGTL